MSRRVRVSALSASVRETPARRLDELAQQRVAGGMQEGEARGYQAAGDGERGHQLQVHLGRQRRERRRRQHHRAERCQAQHALRSRHGDHFHAASRCRGARRRRDRRPKAARSAAPAPGSSPPRRRAAAARSSNRGPRRRAVPGSVGPQRRSSGRSTRARRRTSRRRPSAPPPRPNSAPRECCARRREWRDETPGPAASLRCTEANDEPQGVPHPRPARCGGHGEPGRRRLCERGRPPGHARLRLRRAARGAFRCSAGGAGSTCRRPIAGMSVVSRSATRWTSAAASAATSCTWAATASASITTPECRRGRARARLHGLHAGGRLPGPIFARGCRLRCVALRARRGAHALRRGGDAAGRVPALRASAGGKVALMAPQEAGFRSDPTHVEYMDLARLRQHLDAHGLVCERAYSFPFPRMRGARLSPQRVRRGRPSPLSPGHASGRSVARSRFGSPAARAPLFDVSELAQALAVFGRRCARPGPAGAAQPSVEPVLRTRQRLCGSRLGEVAAALPDPPPGRRARSGGPGAAPGVQMSLWRPSITARKRPAGSKRTRRFTRWGK